MPLDDVGQARSCSEKSNEAISDNHWGVRPWLSDVLRALNAVGATYGVNKLVSDPPHWSDDGH